MTQARPNTSDAPQSAAHRAAFSVLAVLVALTAWFLASGVWRNRHGEWNDSWPAFAMTTSGFHAVLVAQSVTTLGLALVAFGMFRFAWSRRDPRSAAGYLVQQIVRLTGLLGAGATAAYLIALTTTQNRSSRPVSLEAMPWSADSLPISPAPTSAYELYGHDSYLVYVAVTAAVLVLTFKLSVARWGYRFSLLATAVGWVCCAIAVMIGRQPPPTWISIATVTAGVTCAGAVMLLIDRVAHACHSSRNRHEPRGQGASP